MNVTFQGITLDIDTAYIAEPTHEITRQLTEYDTGTRQTFNLSVEFLDSFAGEVMRAMDDIPYGETRTYGDIAASLNTAPIAVGQACGRNPVPIIIPCHRVVSATGLGGYSAGGARNVELKERLLSHEAAHTT